MLARTIITIMTLFVFGSAVSAEEDLKYRTFSVINAANGLADNSAQTLSTTRSGRMIITTIGNVDIFDGNTFSHVDSENNKTYRLGEYEGNYHTYFDQDHHFWLKDKHKVSCVDLHTEKFVPDIAKIFRAEGVKGNVDDLFTDADKRLWLVSNGRLWGDKSKYSIPISRHAKLQDIYSREDTLLLFYSDSKIEQFDLKTKKLVKSAYSLDRENGNKYGKTTIYVKYKDGYFQLRSGDHISVLLWIDGKTLHSTQLMEEDYFLCNLTIFDNLLYISSSYGYWTIDLKTGEKFHRAILDMDDGRKLQTDINAIDFDKQGGMWIGTEKRGLLYSKPHVSPFIVYKWGSSEAGQYWKMMDGLKSSATKTGSGEDVNCVFKDSRGWTWIGLMNGIKVTDRNGRTIKRIKGKDGMLNEVVHSIVEDNHHNMWAGTSNGIVGIRIDKGKIGLVNSYNTIDGVPAESFKNGKALLLNDGSIVMQAVDHVIKFDPKKFHTMGKEETILTAKFVRLMVNGVYAYAGTEIGGRKVLENVASQTKEINLSYDQNFINMTFSGLNYFRPYQTYYRYRVVGYYDEWKTTNYYDRNGLVDNNGLLHLPLPGLNPGHYVVEIQASMYPGQWDGSTTSIKINVLQPWWRSTLTYFIATIIILTLLGYNIFCYKSNYKTSLTKNANEQMIIRQLQTFIQRSEIMAKEMLKPRSGQVYMANGKNDVSADFVDIMMKISPMLRRDTSTLSAVQLSAKAGIPLEQFHKCVAANINKSPRILDRHIRMRKACDIMRTNPNVTIGEVAAMVNFASINFFIAAFYRQYKITPKQYRSKMTVWRQ